MVDPINRDFPDKLRPTTVVDFSGDSITIREISKHFIGSDKGASSRRPAMMLLETALMRCDTNIARLSTSRVKLWYSCKSLDADRKGSELR